MPLYEFYCPQCETKFEGLRTIARGRFARCPECNHRSYRVPSRFSWKWLNPFTKDGEGFTTKHVSMGELTEMNKECRDR